MIVGPFNTSVKIEDFRRLELERDIGPTYEEVELPPLDLLTQAIDESIAINFECGQDGPLDPEDDNSENNKREVYMKH